MGLYSGRMVHYATVIASVLSVLALGGTLVGAICHWWVWRARKRSGSQEVGLIPKQSGARVDRAMALAYGLGASCGTVNMFVILWLSTVVQLSVLSMLTMLAFCFALPMIASVIGLTCAFKPRRYLVVPPSLLEAG